MSDDPSKQQAAVQATDAVAVVEACTLPDLPGRTPAKEETTKGTVINHEEHGESTASTTAQELETTTEAAFKSPQPDAHQPDDASAIKPPSSKSLVDYKDVDYRGFMFVVHAQWGMLLLHCTRKKKKGSYYQVPGGHVDKAEFVRAAQECHDEKSQLLLATKLAAARELWEETGMDIRNQLDRLKPTLLRTETVYKKNKELLPNEFKHRLFYFLEITDLDFHLPMEDAASVEALNLVGAKGSKAQHLKLRLSEEHSGFAFERNPMVAATLLQDHSGGNVSEALLMAMEPETPSDATPTTSSSPEPTTSSSPDVVRSLENSNYAHLGAWFGRIGTQ